MTTTEDNALMDKAHNLLEMGGMSGTTRDFLEQIVWFGWSVREEARYFEMQRMRQLCVLYSLN